MDFSYETLHVENTDLNFFFFLKHISQFFEIPNFSEKSLANVEIIKPQPSTALANITLPDSGVKYIRESSESSKADVQL